MLDVERVEGGFIMDGEKERADFRAIRSDGECSFFLTRFAWRKNES